MSTIIKISIIKNWYIRLWLNKLRVSNKNIFNINYVANMYSYIFKHYLRYGTTYIKFLCCVSLLCMTMCLSSQCARYKSDWIGPSLWVLSIYIYFGKVIIRKNFLAGWIDLGNLDKMRPITLPYKRSFTEKPLYNKLI